jgi:hypothetical protein
MAGKEMPMRPDRPVIGGIVCLATGIALIVGYCNGTSSFFASYPLAGCKLHIDLTTTGPGVLGGLLLIAVGVLFMAWALLAAFVSQLRLLLHRDEQLESIVGRYRAPTFESDDYQIVPPEAEHKHRA